MNRHEIEGYRGPFLKRNGEDARAIAEKLVLPPERPLNEVEILDVRDFESKVLFDYEIEPGLTIEGVVRKHKSDDITAPRVFAEAFVRGAVKVPEGIELPAFTNHQEVYTWFAERAEDKSIATDTLRNIAKGSATYYKNAVAQALLKNETIPSELEARQSIVLDPDAAIELAANTLIARQHLLEIRSLYSEETGSNLDGAKRALTDAYLAKINAEIASDTPMMNYLISQAELTHNPELARAAVSAIPQGFQAGLSTEGGFSQSEMDRLDYIRSGMGLDSDAKATPISEKLFAGGYEEIQRTSHEAIFTPEQVEVLRQTMLKPEQMKQLFENVLKKQNLLSVEPASTWNTERGKRAADELFQVIENPGKDTFEVSGTDGTYRHASVPRSVYDVLFTGGTHELTHVDQAQADVKLGEQIKLAGLKGKRVGVFKEGGANAKQRAAEMEYTGQSKPVALTYAKALQVLRDGGSLMDASRAFFDEKRVIMPEVSPADAAKEAADRVLRLLRRGGSSAVLSYGEEGVIADELAEASDEVRIRAGAITSLDLVDQYRLHRYGLFKMDEDAGVDWTPIVLEELQPYIDEAFAKAGV